MLPLDIRPSPSSEPGSGESLGTRLDRVCDAFEAQWRTALRHEGERPRIATFLEGVAPEELWAFLRELLLTDSQYLDLTGAIVDPREYQQQFPQFADLVPSLFRKAVVLDRLRDYRLLEVIGRGGMGVVYKAQHLRLGKIRAVKVLARHLLDNPEAVERFRLEVENSGRLDHPNIVQALDAGEENEIRFLVMEFVTGWNLTQVVAAFQQGGRQVPLEAACELIRQASAGLQHAHEHSLVHRDIKPSNLMLSERGVVKLLDLGLARFIAEHPPASRLTLNFGPLGTCDYMAPEQWADASSVDIRADIYSLGCTLFYLLTGKVPFGSEHGRSLGEKQLAHQFAPLPSLLDERPDLPEDLQAVLERMIAKSPADRYATPAAVVQDLSVFANSDSVGLLLSVLRQPAGPGDAPAGPPASSANEDTGRPHRVQAHARRSAARPWYRRTELWVAVGLLFVGAFGVADRWISRRVSDEAGPAVAPAELARNVALLSGLDGQWWFDAMPWFTPSVRTAVTEALGAKGVRAVVGDNAEGYLKPDVSAVQKWLLDAVSRCRGALTESQRRLLDQLKAISSAEDRDLEQHLQTCYDEFCRNRGEDAPWTADDLYTRALLEHKLAALRHDARLAQRALKSYDAALDQYGDATGDEPPLSWLCRADSARLLFAVLTDYEQAFERFEEVAAEDAPLLFHVETLAAYAQAGQVAGDYSKDENLRLAKRLLEGSQNLSRSHPLWAYVSERYAWSLLDQWEVKQAADEFESAYSIRFINSRENPFATIFVFQDIYGKAMTERYRGKVENARTEFEDLLAKIDAELKKVEGRPKRPGLQRYVRNLRERKSNALERRADCELYQGGAADPATVDLALASSCYQQASEAAEDQSFKTVQGCKRCLALALSGDVRQARTEFSEEAISQRTLIGAGQERVSMLRQLTQAVLTLKERGPAEGQAALRQFLVHCDRNPYDVDRLRRETLELQLFCAELLLASELADADTRGAAQQDATHLENLLRQLEEMLSQRASGEEMLPFLRRYYDLAIAAVGDAEPDRAARLILASRGGDANRDADAVTILFHLHERDGLAVVLPPEGASAAFRLDNCGRQQVQGRRRGAAEVPDLRLPEPLRQLIQDHLAAGRKIDCLWSDLQCWPEHQRRLALTDQEFPFADLLETATVH